MKTKSEKISGIQEARSAGGEQMNYKLLHLAWF